MDEIERRFKPIDNYLKKYLKEYKKINKHTQDVLQNIFNELDIGYNDLNKVVPSKKKERLDRRLKELLKKKEDNYLYYLLNKTLNKKKITYRDLLETYILSAYYEERKSLDEYDNVFFYEALETSYMQGIEDIRKLRPKRRHIDEIFNWSILYTILNIPLLYGTKDAYLYALSLTNADEMYKRVINDLQGVKNLDIDSTNMQELIKKQQNRLISINNGKTSGAIENMIESYSNLAYLQSGLDNDIRKCRFIAEIDDKTTKMCESLNNQIFYLDKMNTYQRYSDIDKRIVTYYTKGLVLGENLPPIMNHFHWCRSTITYLIDIDISYDSEERVKERELSKLKTLKTINGVMFDNGYIDNDGIFHPKKEEKIKIPEETSTEFLYAKWIKENLGGEIHMVPKIETAKGVKNHITPEVPDYIWNNKKWDLKELKNVTSSYAVTNSLKKHQEQAHDFFLDITNCNLTTKEIIKQIDNVYGDGEKRIDWVNEIILTKNNEIIEKFKR